MTSNKDPLHLALDKVRENRYSDSARYLTDIVTSLALGGRHRAVDLSEITLLDEHARLLVFDLLSAKAKGTYHEDVWKEIADKMLNATKGA